MLHVFEIQATRVRDKPQSVDTLQSGDTPKSGDTHSLRIYAHHTAIRPNMEIRPYLDMRIYLDIRPYMEPTIVSDTCNWHLDDPHITNHLEIRNRLGIAPALG